MAQLELLFHKIEISGWGQWQCLTMTRDYYLDYVRNYCKPMRKRTHNRKIGKRYELVSHQRGNPNG